MEGGSRSVVERGASRGVMERASEGLLGGRSLCLIGLTVEECRAAGRTSIYMDSATSGWFAPERWRQRAQRARDAFGLVLLLVLATYVLASLIDNEGWTAVVLLAVTTATSVVALVSSHARPRFVRAAIVFSGASIVLGAIGAATGERAWLNVASMIQVTLLAIAMLAVLRRVVTTAEIGSRTILGAISVYTVLGILFSFAYSTVDRIQSGPFFSEVTDPKGSEFLFFSYTTLTTTGYGNLVPAGQPGRMLAGLEMMLGQLFLVTLVAGLVSLWRPGERLLQRRGGGAGEHGGSAAGPGGGAEGVGGNPEVSR